MRLVKFLQKFENGNFLLQLSNSANLKLWLCLMHNPRAELLEIGQEIDDTTIL